VILRKNKSNKFELDCSLSLELCQSFKGSSREVGATLTLKFGI